MAGCCSDNCGSTHAPENPRYRKALWAALFINALMFLVEFVGGLQSGSVSLLADAVDFAGDAANYGISLAVLSIGLLWRARRFCSRPDRLGSVVGRTAGALHHGRDCLARAMRQCLGGRHALRLP